MLSAEEMIEACIKIANWGISLEEFVGYTLEEIEDGEKN